MTQHDDDDAPEHSKKAGEGWVVTFADMMSLLMSFFVLLLSFSEQDTAKFKEVGGSLEQAFGVQRDIVAYQIPKGTSIVAKEYSPGKPKPTALNEIRQSTIDDMDQTLEFDPKDHPEHKKQEEENNGPGTGNADFRKMSTVEVSKALIQALSQEVKEGKIQIIGKDQRIIIRVLDQGSFASGDNSLHPSFEPVLDKIANLLDEIPGKITISGHTDDKPIANKRYHSNWELSAARAVTVAQHLYDRGVDGSRIVVSGYAATQPLYPNDTDEHRSRNRRVEIELTQGDKPRNQDVPEINTIDKQIQQPLREILVNQPQIQKKTKPITIPLNNETDSDKIKTKEHVK